MVRRNDKPNSVSVSEYIILSASDVKDLPTSTKPGADGSPTCYPGSIAYTPDVEHVYMLGPDDVWAEL